MLFRDWFFYFSLRNVLGVFLLFLVGFFFFFSSFFSLRAVVFSGHSLIPFSSLTDFSTSFYGKNIFYLTFTPFYKQRLLNAFPQFDSLSLSLIWPNQLHVSITEKQPWISFFVEGDHIIVSRDGTILVDSDDLYFEKSDQLLIIKGFSKDYFGQTHISDALCRSLVSFVDLLRASFPDMVLHLERDFWGQWTIWNHDTLPIKIGVLEDFKYKKDLLVSFFEYQRVHPSDQRMVSLDLTGNDRVLVTYAK